jgi:transposase-like protein
MGRPSGTKNNMRSTEEKERLILEYQKSRIGYRKFAADNEIYPSIFHKWIMLYREKGIKGLESNIGKSSIGKGRPQRAKTEVESLKREITKLEIEIARLKKGYQVKGVGAQKEFVTTFDVNTK